MKLKPDQAAYCPKCGKKCAYLNEADPLLRFNETEKGWEIDMALSEGVLCADCGHFFLHIEPKLQRQILEIFGRDQQ